jgi:uncharacterized protein with FMN-binding domain
MARGRPCSICANAATVGAVDAALSTGSSVAETARLYAGALGFSESALYRHARHQHDPKSTLGTPMPDGEGFADNIRVLVAVQRSQLEALARADAKGDDRLAASAADRLRAVTKELLDAGITDDDVAEDLRYNALIVRALKRATRNDPEFARALASAALEFNDKELAADAEDLAKAAERYADFISTTNN